MTHEHDYVYAFEAILETKDTPPTLDGLLLSLKLPIQESDSRWKELRTTVEAKTKAGYDFAQGRASLAILCQDILKKKQKPFEVNSLTVPPNEEEPWKKNIRIKLATELDTIEHQEPLRKNYVGIAFPHVLKAALTKVGFKNALQGVRVEDGIYNQFYVNGDLFHQVRSFFYDHLKDVGWWSVGVGRDYIAATIQATVLGYYAAIDPRRHNLPDRNQFELRENYLAYRDRFKLAS